MDKELDSKFFAHDEAKIKELETKKPWASNPKFFSNCRVSALAAMRMLKHSMRGVKKGRARDGGKGLPLEVMGLMVGRPQGDTVVILDAIPLPCDGFESEWNVNIGEKAATFMVEINEQIEKRNQKEKLIGWYHSHPFDVGAHDNCFMSAIDVNTQTMNQLGTSKYWTAIVVDPLRCMEKGRLCMRSFRTYPRGFCPPAGTAPDGERLSQSKGKNWGSNPEKYYELQISYFMSSVGRNAMKIFSQDSLWIQIISNSQIDDEEYRAGLVKRVEKLSSAQTTAAGPGFGPSVMATIAAGQDAKAPSSKLVESATEIAHEVCQDQAASIVRNVLFNFSPASGAGSEGQRGAAQGSGAV